MLLLFITLFNAGPGVPVVAILRSRYTITITITITITNYLLVCGYASCWVVAVLPTKYPSPLPVAAKPGMRSITFIYSHDARIVFPRLLWGLEPSCRGSVRVGRITIPA